LSRYQPIEIGFLLVYWVIPISISASGIQNMLMCIRECLGNVSTDIDIADIVKQSSDSNLLSPTILY